MLGTDGGVLSRPIKKQILTVLALTWEISTVKDSIEKPILLNFLHLSTIFRSKLMMFSLAINTSTLGNRLSPMT